MHELHDEHKGDMNARVSLGNQNIMLQVCFAEFIIPPVGARNWHNNVILLENVNGF